MQLGVAATDSAATMQLGVAATDSAATMQLGVAATDSAKKIFIDPKLAFASLWFFHHYQRTQPRLGPTAADL